MIQDNSEILVNGQNESSCPAPDKDCCPKIPSSCFNPCDKIELCEEYKEVGEYDKKDFDFKKKSAKQAAVLAFDKVKFVAEDVKMQAKADFEAAERKCNSVKTNLDIQLELDKEKMKMEYDACKKVNIPKGCPINEDEIPCPKLIICQVQHKLNTKKKETKYIEEIQKNSQEMMTAKHKCKKAQCDYIFAICNAEAVKREADLTAELDWRNALSKALEKMV